jgi:TonB family protein
MTRRPTSRLVAWGVASLAIHATLILVLVKSCGPSESVSSTRVQFVSLMDGLMGGGDSSRKSSTTNISPQKKQAQAANTEKAVSVPSDSAVSPKGSNTGTGTQPGVEGRLPGGSEDVLRAIKRKILSAKRYPPLAKQRKLQGDVSVRFDIDPSGRIGSSAVTSSSGAPVLDAEALATLTRAEPYPAYAGAITMVLKFRLSP